MTKIIGTDHPVYKSKWKNLKQERFNGAYYYAKEIERNIIPKIDTDRNWVLLNVRPFAFNHSIIFIHNNMYPFIYDWLGSTGFRDLVLVCGVPETCEKVKHIGRTIYLPLSVDVKEVEQYKTRKTRGAAFVGRQPKRNGITFPSDTDFIEGLPRQELLQEMAKYKTVYAVGRTAIEAKILGCNIEPYDPRFPDPSIWKVVDNSEAAAMLQERLNEIDGQTVCDYGRRLLQPLRQTKGFNGSRWRNYSRSDNSSSEECRNKSGRYSHYGNR